MKINMPKNYRQIFTLEEYDQVKNMIAILKDDGTPVTYYAEMAAQEVIRHGNTPASWLDEIVSVKAEAEINRSLGYDFMGENCGQADVCLTVIAETGEGFLKIWAMLSDVFQVDGTANFAHKWYYKYYGEQD